jgi:hypothetical protein
VVPRHLHELLDEGVFPGVGLSDHNHRLLFWPRLPDGVKQGGEEGRLGSQRGAEDAVGTGRE